MGFYMFLMVNVSSILTRNAKNKRGDDDLRQGNYNIKKPQNLGEEGLVTKSRRIDLIDENLCSYCDNNKSSSEAVTVCKVKIENRLLTVQAPITQCDKFESDEDTLQKVIHIAKTKQNEYIQKMKDR